MYAELLNIQRKLGAEKFPLIPLKYHPNGHLGTKQNLIPFKKYPAVIKGEESLCSTYISVGSTHAGFGKIIAHNEDEYYDVESILALNSDYFTWEFKYVVFNLQHGTKD